MIDFFFQVVLKNSYLFLQFTLFISQYILILISDFSFFYLLFY
ncbi:hypothetical protein CY0110_19997 [Crocosphaera chwakensis CCY0110]|uniref:Uncharacterized protein n=1 Tax=Crocosphaera chwakensis CCY0110 TaxID=391612 RepID=A3IJY1_9CHRO|nr:hypothetical protein CY0110_19997 [Crocosphaera chwakensis CCY0110]